jgi:hypothetical protein
MTAVGGVGTTLLPRYKPRSASCRKPVHDDPQVQLGPPHEAAALARSAALQGRCPAPRQAGNHEDVLPRDFMGLRRCESTVPWPVLTPPPTLVLSDTSCALGSW